MNYKLHYDKLIEKAKNRVLNKHEYNEKHHIIPRCLGGTNDKSNIVKLLPKEHYIAHLLLFREYPSNQKLAYAFWMMCNGNKKDKRTYKISGRLYEEVRTKFIEILKEREPTFKGKNHTIETKEKISKSKKGKLPPVTGKKYSQESKDKQSKARLGKKDSLETRMKKSKSMTGIKKSKEHALKISLAQKGENNNMYGVTGYNNKRSKIVFQYNTDGDFIKEWPNARIAAQELNLNYTAINDCCRGKQKTSQGFIWRYKEI
jgi:hypothetical protein